MKKCILIVDGDPQICESLAKVFRSEGYDVDSVIDARESVKKFEEQQPDLVLLDPNLPGNNGWEIFLALSSSNPFVPIMIITGKQHQSEFAKKAGVDAFMEKPLDVPLLLKTIARLIVKEPEVLLKA